MLIFQGVFFTSMTMGGTETSNAGSGTSIDPWNMSPSKPATSCQKMKGSYVFQVTTIGDTPIFRFHDYGRKGNM